MAGTYGAGPRLVVLGDQVVHLLDSSGAGPGVERPGVSFAGQGYGTGCMVVHLLGRNMVLGGLVGTVLVMILDRDMVPSCVAKPVTRCSIGG